ncbi:MAG: threonine--tRNA ligase [Gaiellales bacterium]
MNANLPPHDHRRLGRELDLFFLPERAPGQVFWKPRGMIVRRELERMLESELAAHGYQQVSSPLLWSQDLWQQSGHAAKFHDDMVHADVDGRAMSLKPMSCPGHCQLYLERPRSYRELPIRLAEFGHCHRAEPSGSLHGLLRVRGFVQDDAHIFCSEQQVASEVEGCLRLALSVYSRFGFEPEIELSLRPDMRFGDDRVWDADEAALRCALQRVGHPYREMPGEGAFYGPKIDCKMVDRLGRRWQLGSVQLDHVLPSAERFDLRHVAAGGAEQPVVMIHRALFGSFERFIAVLLEHSEGWLPMWLAPLQAIVLPVGDAQAGYARDVQAALAGAGLRSDVWDSESLGARVRRARVERVPSVLVCGQREMQAGSVSVRRRGRDQVEPLPVASAVEALQEEAKPGRLPS